MHNHNCFVNHMGIWLMESLWITQAVQAIQDGIYKAVEIQSATGTRETFDVTRDGTAVISINGPMMKGFSKYGGASTVFIRQQLRSAVADKDVSAILLHVDSPGGHVAGTQDLANDVINANKIKPVFAQIDDLGASASYWVASQARAIFANETAQVGSIGVVAVVHDSSEAFKAEGVKVHVVSTGSHKGAFTQGTEVTEDQLSDLQSNIDSINNIFLNAVKKGRGMDINSVRAVADGRVFIASKAKELGLVDGVQSMDDTFKYIQNYLKTSARNSRAEDLGTRLESMITAEPGK